MRISVTLFFLACVFTANCQLLTWSPAFITESSTPIEITVDATKGNQGLLNYTPTTDVYVHTGVITSTSGGNWSHVPTTWGTTNPAYQCTYVGNNKWKFTITGGLRAFYGVTDPNEKILKIAILFRNGAGSKVQRNADGSDMYVPVYESGLNVRIDQPYREPKFTPVPEQINKTLGDNIAITANASVSSTLKLYLNGVQVGTTASNATTISANPTISSYGAQMIVAEAVSGTTAKYDTISFFVSPPIVVAPLPAGVRDGINYEPGDTSVTLVLFAPYKTRAALLGDFNGWKETSRHQMYRTPDSSRYWIRLTGLTPGVEYGYQYYIDGQLKVADVFSEKVLDPYNDQYIPAANYPNLKPYPTGLTTGVVSVLQTAKPAYNWQVNNFARPDKRNLVIYELLVRDFVATQRWQTLIDTLPYLTRLGINAIELMPINEFEGNISWGYNPDFYFAPDKAYGTENAFRAFVDACHSRGIAVIMDIAMNHAFGLSPTVQMYFNATTGKPAANNPWHNVDATHPFNVGYDFNHESAATKGLVSRVIEHWTNKYKVDGFRWDLSKGFTQTNSGNDVNLWSQYDASRIAIWKRYYDTMQAKAPGSYCILEHFAANSEEIELSNYGMLLWGNMNYNYNEATMGYVSTSNLSGGIYTDRGWTQPNLVTYMESHDEERLMYKNELYGNTSGTYSAKDTATALSRTGMAAAFWAATPAPKMLWQFGELGYDYSINTCEDLSVNTNCRTSPKPIRWDYLNNPNRVALYNVYSKMLKMRNVPNYLPAFVTNNVQYSLTGAFKWLKVTSDSLKIVVVGNFDVATNTGSVTFPSTGTWYDYLNNTTKAVTTTTQNFSLLPGEYHVYVDRNVAAAVTALPLKLLSFAAQRTSQAVSLGWFTANEVAVKEFVVERSFNGTEFNGIGIVAASNSFGRTQYKFEDIDPLAVKAVGKIYYRLRMVDRDGKYSYSNIAVINPSAYEGSLSLYPNPAKGSNLFVELSEAASGKIQIAVQDLSGRLITAYNVSATGQPISVDIKGLKNGTYVLKTVSNSKTTVQQFVVQH